MTPTQIQKNIRSEFKQWSVQPKPQKDWEMVWVLTGATTTLGGTATLNDTRRRLEEGIRLAKKIASLKKSATRAGAFPEIYVSGYNEHNTNLKKYRSEGFFEKAYSFPAEKLRIGPQEDILHTGHQFEKFPRKFLTQFEKIVIVTDSYHIPRVARYVDTFFKTERERFVLYPAKPFTMSRRQINAETDKILAYSEKGIIPLFMHHAAAVRVVITGATGFIGSHLVSGLLPIENISVVSFDRTKHSFTDKKSLQELLKGADFIFHLAAIKRAEQKEAFRFNISSTKALLDAMRVSAPDAVFVFASSFAVYRIPKKGEIVDEKFALLPKSEYGISKLKCEKLIQEYVKRYSIRAVALRIANPYGPTSKISSSIIDSLKSSVETGVPVSIRGSLEETRDFIYISDVVAACKKLLTQVFKKRSFTIFNICTGEETSIGSLLKMVERLTGHPIPLILHSNANHISGFWKGSLQKAKRELQWQPIVGIRRGLRLVFPIT